MAQAEFDRTMLLPSRAKRTLVVFSHGLAISLFWLLAGCNPPGRPTLADMPSSPDQSLDFGVLYGRNCAGCHGGDGKLGPAPPLNDPLFRAIVSDTELRAVLTKGRKESLMPAFSNEDGGMLTDPQIQVLVMEIKGVRYKIVKKTEGDLTDVKVVADGGGISPKWGAPEMPPKGAPSYDEGSASSAGSHAGTVEDGTVKNGVVAFARACAVCHGGHGQGIRPLAASGEKGETVRTIHDPALLGLMSNQTLRRYIITGRPDLGMPDYANARPDDPKFAPLNDEEVTDLVALLASWRSEK